MRSPRHWAHRGGFLALVFLVLLVWLSAAATTAGAAPVVGTESITRPGVLTPLDSGGSGTPYGIALPAGASCPGDTAHQGYHVFSYLVPKDVSPASVDFKTGHASKGFGYISYGSYYGAVNTAEGTGQIMGFPLEFTWSRLTTKDLFSDGQKSSTWEGGIACANSDGGVTNYWNSQIVFTASASDPRGFTWQVVADPVLGPSHKWIWVGVALIVLSIALAAFAVFLSRRHDQSSAAGPSSDGPPSEAGRDAPEPSVAGR